ncbi:MAG: carbonic anhydrase [Ignavibacteriaceae bacterium]
MKNAIDSLIRLREGNKRFLSGNSHIPDLVNHDRRSALVADQKPFAIILGCSDSRVPAEIVFDQGLGDLFVIRIAGNIVAPSQIGSVEFAVEYFGTPLVVILGHSNCGAVKATINEFYNKNGKTSKNLLSIVNRIRPSVESVLQAVNDENPEVLLHKAVRANISASAENLRHGSEIIQNLVDNNQLLIVGAEYSLETGEVDFFDGIPIF